MKARTNHIKHVSMKLMIETLTCKVKSSLLAKLLLLVTCTGNRKGHKRRFNSEVGLWSGLCLEMCFRELLLQNFNKIMSFTFMFLKPLTCQPVYLVLTCFPFIHRRFLNYNLPFTLWWKWWWWKFYFHFYYYYSFRF